MLEGQYLYKYNQTSGTAWDWQAGSMIGYSWFSSYGEIFIPRSWMEDTNEIRVFFKGRNDTNNDGVVDWNDEVDYFPDTALEGDSEFVTAHDRLS